LGSSSFDGPSSETSRLSHQKRWAGGKQAKPPDFFLQTEKVGKNDDRAGGKMEKKKHRKEGVASGETEMKAREKKEGIVRRT